MLLATGVRAHAVACDLHLPAQIAEAVQQAAAWLGAGSRPGEPARIDLLVNNAGAFETRSSTPYRSSSGTTCLPRTPGRPCCRAGGPAILTGSSRSTHPEYRLARGFASLGNARPLLRLESRAAHAYEDNGQGVAPAIAVNCVAPGMIVTGEEAGEGYAHFVAKTPMARNGRVSDVAEVVLYLASATPFLTGQILAVDGGLGL